MLLDICLIFRFQCGNQDVQLTEKKRQSVGATQWVMQYLRGMWLGGVSI